MTRRRGLRPAAVPVRAARRARSDSPTRCPAASSTARSARRAIRCPRSRRARPRGALDASMGYPASAGSAGAPRRRRGVDRAAASASRSTAEQVGACVGTKEFVASLPHLLRLRNPARDTVLYPGGRVPDLRDGRDARRLPCGAGAARRRLAPRSRRGRATPTPSARCVLWVNEPGNPTSLGRRRRALRRDRRRGRASAASSSRATSATPSTRPSPRRSCARGDRRRARGAQPVEALEPGRACASASTPATPSSSRISSRPASTPGSWCRPRCRPRPRPRSATTSTSPSSARATRNGASS